MQAEPMTIFISFFVSTKMKFWLAYANKKVTKRDKEKKRYEKEVILIPFHKGGVFQPGHQKWRTTWWPQILTANQAPLPSIFKS